MVILHKLCKFNLPDKEMVIIYTLFIRSILEQSCAVCHVEITHDEISDIKRVQKVACKVILKDGYSDYTSFLSLLNPKNLNDRRDDLCLRFAKECFREAQPESFKPEEYSEVPLKV